MTSHKAGETVEYTVTFLEMTSRPGYDWPSIPSGLNGALLRADAPPVWYFRALYDAVGADYAWTDLHSESPSLVADWLSDPNVVVYSLIDNGWPRGFFVLDCRMPGECEISNFGLVPEAIGRGFGTWMLRTAILTAWAREGMNKLRVNTCTLDHPRALAQYQKQGFILVSQEMRSRRLTRDWTQADSA